MDKLLKSKLVHTLVTFCSATDNFEEYLSCLIDKISFESCSSNREYIKTICQVSDYICSTCDLAKWSQTSEGSSDARQQREVCKLCQSLYDRITDKHALKSPNWENVEWQLIMKEPLQHMKCYIKEYGHREVRKVRQLGLSALIQICSNHCDLKTLFGNVLPFLEKIAETRDQVFQSETLDIGEDELNTQLRKIEDVLKIVCRGTDMDRRSYTMSAQSFNTSQQQFTVEDELNTKRKIIQTLDKRIHSLKCWQTLSGNSQEDPELLQLKFIRNLHWQKLQERSQQLASNTDSKIQRYEKHRQFLKNYTDDINKISIDDSSQYCASGMVGDSIVKSPRDKYDQTLLEGIYDNGIEALEKTHTNQNGIETVIGLILDIRDKVDAGIFSVPGTSKKEGMRTIAQTDSKSDLDSRKIVVIYNRPMETDTPGEASTTTKARLIQSPSELNTQEPLNGQMRSLKRPYQCLESECPMDTVAPNLKAIRTELSLTESSNSVNSAETVPEHISLLERPLQYLEEGGNTICRINHEYMAFYLRCPNLLNVINLCEDVLNGKVEALFMPLQDYLRTQPDFNNVSVVVDISGNDFTRCIMPCLIKLNRQLDLRIQQLEYPYKQKNKASTAAGNTDMKTAISMLKDLIDHHPSVDCETPSELRLTVDTLGVEDSHTLTRHLVDAANELQRYKKNVKYRETLQNTDQHEKNGIETAISIFKELKGHIPFIDETSELRLKVEVIGVKDGHSLTRQIFHTAIELQSTEESITSNSQELRQYLQHVVQYLKKDGNTLNIRETDCSAFYICCPTLANAMTLCEDCITGKVEALFQPLQSYLKTLPECQDVSIVVDISENDFVNCILPSLTAIKRLLESCVPAQGPDSRGSVAVSKYADKGIESCTSNKQVSSFDDQFSVHPWDRLISQLCEEFSVEDSDFENILLGSKTRIGDDNYNRIQSLDGRSGQKYHAFFDCLERKFGQHDSVEFLLHLIATLNFHSNSACVTYTTAFEQYKQDIEELHLTTKGLVMEPSCKIVDILQKRPEENVSSYERHPKGVVLWGPLGMGMTRFLNQILWRLRFGSFTTSIVRQWNIVAVNQRDKTEVKELSSNMINNIRKEMGMQDIICDLISVNDQKQNLMTLLKDLGKRKGDYLVLLDDMDGHFKNEHSPCEQFLTDVMDTIAEVDNIKIILTVSKSVSKSNVIDSFGGKLVFGGHMLEFNLTEEILTENIPTEEILMPKISCLEDQNDRLSLDDLDKLLIKANQTIIQATEAGSRFSEESERTIHKDLNTFEATKQAGKDRIENQTQAGEKRIEIKIQESIKLINRTVIEKEQDEYERGVSDLLKRLVNHYRDTVCYVPQSTLDPSLDKHVQDVYSTPKIHNMKIENDGRRTKQELILTYRDCFYRGDHLSRRTYLQGEPGSGKTSFAAKLVHDWCNVYEPLTESKEQTAFGDVDTLHKFKFFFFISLRDSREQTHVTHMIQTQLIYKIYAADEWESAYNLVLKIMRNVMYLVVQDGLDEWPGKEALPSMDGIPKDHCIVLTTSRPWKLADERIKNSQIDILLEVYGIIDSEGFSERILRHHLDETKDLNKTVYQFQEFLESRDLISISSSPMLHTLVLCAWVDDMAESLTGSSLCELYTTLLENLCKKCNPQMSYFDQHHQSPVNCFSRTKYVKPNMVHIDAIAKAAFAFLFSNEKEQSLVFSDINLSVHLSESTKQFALHSGLISKRKSIKCYDNTSSFVHKTVQEFFAALHISNNTDVIDNVTCEYLKSNRDSYLDISQVFIFLCGFNILAANKLSALMNQVEDDRHGFDHYVFQSVILSGYREAVANKNTPIDLHLSHFHVWRDNAEDLINIFALNAPRARSLHVFFIDATIRSQDASSSLCQGPISLPARDNADPSTRAKQKEVRSSASCLEFDFSACHNLEQLKLEGDITVLPNALVGLKKLKYLTMNIGCKCEALDMSHYEHIESIELGEGVTLLPHCITKYKNLKYIKIHSVYKELDLSMFENLNSITISKQVQVLPKQLLIHNNQKLKYIGLHEFDFNRCDKKDIHTWCLLNGADPVLCADYTPVLPSIKHIQLSGVTCSSTWLRSLLTTLFTLDHRVKCSLEACDITKLDHVKPSLKHVYGESCINVCITTDLNNTCQLDVAQDCPGLWETLLGLSVKNLSLSNGSYYFRKLKAYHDSPLSWSLVQLSQLETLRMHLSEYIDLLLPLSLDHVTVCFDTLNPSELRQLVNKLSAWTHSLECRFELCCGYYKDTGIMHIIPSEEYIPIQQELEAMQHVDVKRFRIYDWTTSTSEWSERDSVVDDGDHGDEIVDEQFCADFYRTNRDGLSRISIRLKINCA